MHILTCTSLTHIPSHAHPSHTFPHMHTPHAHPSHAHPSHISLTCMHTPHMHTPHTHPSHAHSSRIPLTLGTCTNPPHPPSSPSPITPPPHSPSSPFLLTLPPPQDIEELMSEGNKSRTVAATQMNAESSRSHAVFSILLTQTKFDPQTQVSSKMLGAFLETF